MSTLSDMIRLARNAGLLLAISALAPVALADNAAPASGSQVCLQSREIDHTKILNDHQILFYMTGKKVWVNTLPNKCSALRYDEGFVHVSSTNEYCDNLETITVRPTHETCLLGKFTPYEKPAP
jgi:hypothetical protein